MSMLIPSQTVSLTEDQWNFVALRYNSMYSAATKVLYDFGVLSHPSDIHPADIATWAFDLPPVVWDRTGRFPLNSEYLRYLSYLFHTLQGISEEDVEILETLALAVYYDERLAELQELSETISWDSPTLTLVSTVRGKNAQATVNGLEINQGIGDVVASVLGLGSAHFDAFSSGVYKVLFEKFTSYPSRDFSDISDKASGYFTNLPLKLEIDSVSGWARPEVILSNTYGERCIRWLEESREFSSVIDSIFKNDVIGHFHIITKYSSTSHMISPHGRLTFDDSPLDWAFPSYGLWHSGGRVSEVPLPDQLLGYSGDLREDPRGIFFREGVRYSRARVRTLNRSYYDFYMDHLRRSGNTPSIDSPITRSIDHLHTLVNEVRVSDLVFSLPSSYSLTDVRRSISDALSEFEVEES